MVRFTLHGELCPERPMYTDFLLRCGTSHTQDHDSVFFPQIAI